MGTFREFWRNLVRVNPNLDRDDNLITKMSVGEFRRSLENAHLNGYALGFANGQKEKKSLWEQIFGHKANESIR